MLSRSFISSIKHISLLDPAINREHEDYKPELYRDTGDQKHIPLHDGATPSVFELSPLTRKQLQAVMDVANSLEQVSEAVAYGLKSVTNFSYDGEPIKVEHVTVNGNRRVKSDVLDKLFDPTLFAELGSRILGLNRLDPTKG